MHAWFWLVSAGPYLKETFDRLLLLARIHTYCAASCWSLTGSSWWAGKASIDQLHRSRRSLLHQITSPGIWLLASGKARGAACCFSRKQDWPGARREAAANQHQSGNQTSRQTHFEIYTPVSRAHYIYVVTWRIFFPVLSDCSSCFCATNARRALRETTVVISLISWQHGKGFTC